MPQRLAQINEWLQTQLSLTNYDIQPASSDASFRRYFRITSSAGLFAPYGAQSLIVMDAPPFQEDTRPYIHIAKLMAHVGLNVPLVLEENTEQGFLLLTDLGSTQYLSVLNEDNVNELYKDALDALLKLQTNGPSESDGIPPYDHALLQRELEIFREWYLQKHLGLRLSKEQDNIINDAFSLLIDTALEQPVVCVHRDYHSRNLMQTEKNNPGVLDFQDAVIGPITYDVVSLLKDCYISWPREQVESWALQYKANLEGAGVIEGIDNQQFLRWFDFMGAQRHLKATGIFARLDQRDGKPDYLNDIPRTLSYVIDVTGRYKELHPLNQFLVTIMPSLATQTAT
ncbi:MAG: phosphotransferase [Gammaproteobacteria bacterium]|jgi:aminoglycoside/choline kinase family phosphotransferase